MATVASVVKPASTHPPGFNAQPIPRTRASPPKRPPPPPHDLTPLISPPPLHDPVPLSTTTRRATAKVLAEATPGRTRYWSGARLGKAPAPGGAQAQQQQHPPLASPSPSAALPRKRPFSAALTRDEIAEDFAAIRGTRPPHRPKKRPSAVQRQLDMLYPGLSLADANLDSYKIDEQR